MRIKDSALPLPAAIVADANSFEQEALEHRLKRGFPICFRTRTGILLRLSWSQSRKEFKLSNNSCLATSYTAKAIFRLIVQINAMPDYAEVAA